MVDGTSGKISAAKDKWEKNTLTPHQTKHPDRRKEFVTTSSKPVKVLYTPLDLPDFDYMKDLGFPSEYPYTRGVQPTMHRGRLWTMRQFMRELERAGLVELVEERRRGNCTRRLRRSSRPRGRARRGDRQDRSALRTLRLFACGVVLGPQQPVALRAAKFDRHDTLDLGRIVCRNAGCGLHAGRPTTRSQHITRTVDYPVLPGKGLRQTRRKVIVPTLLGGNGLLGRSASVKQNSL